MTRIIDEFPSYKPPFTQRILHGYATGTREYIWLVVSPHLKNISQLRGLFLMYGKIKNCPNHQPDMLIQSGWLWSKALDQRSANVDLRLRFHTAGVIPGHSQSMPQSVAAPIYTSQKSVSYCNIGVSYRGHWSQSTLCLVSPNASAKLWYIYIYISFKYPIATQHATHLLWLILPSPPQLPMAITLFLTSMAITHNFLEGPIDQQWITPSLIHRSDDLYIHVNLSDWWYTHLSEKYKSQLGWWHSQYMGK